MQTKQIKLSEAIRIGAAKRPQGKGNYFPLSKEHVVCSCVLGAALEGAMGRLRVQSLIAKELYEIFPILSETTSLQTQTIDVSGTLFEVCATLNDTFNWTREQIADWLESEGF